MPSKNELLVSLILVIVTVVLGTAVILILNFFLGGRLLPDSKEQDLVDESLRPYLKRDLGWYELKRNYRGEAHWGNYVYIERPTSMASARILREARPGRRISFFSATP